MKKQPEAPTGKYKEFAHRFRRAIQFAGIEGSYRKAAPKLGISVAFYGDLYRGDKLPGSDNGAQIAQKLGVSFDWLVTGRGAMVLGHDSGTVSISHLSPSDQEAVRSIIKSLESKLN